MQLRNLDNTSSFSMSTFQLDFRVMTLPGLSVCVCVGGRGKEMDQAHEIHVLIINVSPS